MEEMGNKGIGMLVTGAFAAGALILGFEAFESFTGSAEAIVEYQTGKTERVESLLEDVMNGTTTSDDFRQVQDELDQQYDELQRQINNGG